MPRRMLTGALLLSCGGFSTVETSVVIAGVSLLSATAAPHMQEYLDIAHKTKALGDTRVIALSVFRLTTHVGQIGGHQRVRPMILVSDGDVPAGAGPEQRPWLLPLDGGAGQSLTAHLVSNEAGYTVAESHPLRWRGPYFEGLSADPWGKRYAVNVGILRRGGGRAVLVLSPGPNGVVDTPFDAVGLRQTSDDVIGLIGRAP